MKKRYIFGAVILLILLLTSYFIYKNIDSEPSFEDNLIVRISVKNITSEFCGYLDNLNRANSSICATCTRGNEYYKYAFLENKSNSINDIDIVEYTVSKYEHDGKNNLMIEVYVPIKYGWNTRKGVSGYSFELTPKGEVINRDFPEKTCL